MLSTHFHAVDWTIIIVYTLITLFFGYISKNYLRGYLGYLIAERDLTKWLGVATLSSGEIGLVTLMYFAEAGYVNGYAAFIIAPIMLIGMVFIAKTGFILKGLRQLRILTLPEFFGIKYNRPVRLAGALLVFIAGVMNMGLFLSLGGKFMLYMMGIENSYLPLIMAILLIFVLVYTILGGMISVIFTNYIQFVFINVGLLIVTYFAINAVGFSNISQTLMSHFNEVPDGAFNPISNPNYGWAAIIWFVANCIYTWPPDTVRALSAKNTKESSSMFFINSFTLLGRAMIPVMWGACALVFLKMHPEISLPFVNGRPDTQSAMPIFMSHIIPIGITGVLTTAAFAAMMSTFSSYLLTWSSILVNDIVVPGFPRFHFSDNTKIWLTRIFLIGCGIFLFVFGLMYSPPKTALRFIYVTGTMLFASLLGAVALGLYWKKSNAVGAMIAIVVSAVLPLGPIFLEGRVMLSEQWAWIITDKFISPLTFVVAVAGMIIGSLLTQKACPPKSLKFYND
jgi:SSS family solute:Na+ symporter